jgi:hypothetical protein
MRGNRGGTDGASLPLPRSMGGRTMAAHGVAASARLKATEVGEDPRVGCAGQ